MVFNNNLLLGAAGAGGGYEIDQSIRFDPNAYMTRTPASAGSLTTWTASFWFKRSSVSDTQVLFGAATTAINEIRFSSSYDTIYYDFSNLGVYPESTLVLRDPSAWYNLVTVFDTTHATASERLRCFLNGERVTLSATLALNANSKWNSNVLHTIGISSFSVPNYYPFDGYMAEIHFIDGTALDATSFGETNSNGVWVPKAYTNAAGYGTNGFYITGADSADLGADDSGNNNDFTSSGLTTTDQMLDTPTNNFCTLNAVDKATQVVLADGNLQYGLSSNSYTAVRGTFGVSSGKWYWEMSTVSGMAVNTCYMGIATNASNLQVSNAPGDGTTYTYISYTGNKAYTSSSAYGTAWNTNGRVIGVALDLDAGKIWWSRDGVWQASGDPAAGTNEAFSGITGTWHPYVVFNDTSPNLLFNFGQTAFTYTPPTGFNALSTANLATPSITDGSKYFQPTLYTGTGSSLAVTQSGNSTFQPDWVWIKGRSGATEHVLTDAVRGVTKELSSNDTGAEETVAQGLTTFGTAGFTVGTDGSYNTSSATYVGWQWKANGAGSSNTDGSITSTVSADTTSGFSIIRWSGTGANGTIGHGLGIQPSLYIVKNTATTNSWLVGSTLYSNTQFLILNATDTLDTAAAIWNSAYPTSSVVNLGSNVGSNGSGTNNMICYAFAEIPGYSSIGSYEANASTDGPFIYTGFKPSFVLIKNVDAAEEWWIQDDAREPFNGGNMARLAPNSSAAEADNVPWFDFLSNGLKVRYNAGGINASGTHIYMAFAENPFGGDGVAPATAR
jgi:hypothetical protein